ncbi:MAG TPA: hypothetical protein VFO20_16240 [Propionibacteriaceae bacterium]|nr:hypothetical protein [Propionibacteriaceae bacterium]
MQLSRDVLQHCSAGGLDNFSDVVICSILSLRPELKSGEQICRLFNEVDVIRSRPALPLISSSACSHSSSKVAMSQQHSIELVLLSPRLRHQVPVTDG